MGNRLVPPPTHTFLNTGSLVSVGLLKYLVQSPLPPPSIKCLPLYNPNFGRLDLNLAVFCPPHAQCCQGFLFFCLLFSSSKLYASIGLSTIVPWGQKFNSRVHDRIPGLSAATAHFDKLPHRPAKGLGSQHPQPSFLLPTYCPFRHQRLFFLALSSGSCRRELF